MRIRCWDEDRLLEIAHMYRQCCGFMRLHVLGNVKDTYTLHVTQIVPVLSNPSPKFPFHFSSNMTTSQLERASTPLIQSLQLPHRRSLNWSQSCLSFTVGIVYPVLGGSYNGKKLIPTRTNATTAVKFERFGSHYNNPVSYRFRLADDHDTTSL
jgi:hypothetical protein